MQFSNAAEVYTFLNGFINFERKHGQRNEYRLDRIRGLMERAGRPDRAIGCYHVAGSKGKGSTATMLAAVLLQIPDRSFQVAGHTDNVWSGRGVSFEDNWELSTERALSVVRFFQSVGMNPTVLAAVGYGEHQPVADNASDMGREQNRRIEIVLMPNLDELPDLSALESETGQ